MKHADEPHRSPTHDRERKSSHPEERDEARPATGAVGSSCRQLSRGKRHRKIALHAQDGNAPMRNPGDAIFEAAVAHHRAGRPVQADLACRDVLACNPSHAALHLSGVIAFEAGNGRAAADLLHRATYTEGDVAKMGGRR
jgi:Flp pilus assembly protein TadD